MCQQENFNFGHFSTTDQSQILQGVMEQKGAATLTFIVYLVMNG